MCKSDLQGRKFLEVSNFEFEFLLLLLLLFFLFLFFRELCLVRDHDRKLTKEAEKVQKDLAEALLEAEKNAK